MAQTFCAVNASRDGADSSARRARVRLRSSREMRKFCASRALTLPEPETPARKRLKRWAARSSLARSASRAALFSRGRDKFADGGQRTQLASVSKTRSRCSTKPTNSKLERMRSTWTERTGTPFNLPTTARVDSLLWTKHDCLRGGGCVSAGCLWSRSSPDIMKAGAGCSMQGKKREAENRQSATALALHLPRSHRPMLAFTLHTKRFGASFFNGGACANGAADAFGQCSEDWEQA